VRRVGGEVAMSLIGGLLLTVIIAWTCAVRGRLEGGAVAGGVVAGSGPQWVVVWWTRPWGRRTRGERFSTATGQAALVPPTTVPADAVPGWSIFADPPPVTEPPVIRLEDAIGWPWPALRTTWTYDRDAGRFRIEGGLRLEPHPVPPAARPRWFPIGVRSVPLRPVWSGLALDTLAWAAVIMTVLASIRALVAWWRGKPGHCRCGYDLRGAAHPRCPECGRPTAA
jgi:hypothetical protein